MRHFDFRTRLTPATWASCVGKGPLTQSGWAKPATDGVHFDLAKVEWADFGTMADLLLLADRAVTDGVPCRVTLPMLSSSEGELAHAELAGEDWLARRLRRRRDARSFMEHSGFIKSLQPSHWGPASIEWVEASPSLIWEDGQPVNSPYTISTDTGSVRLLKVFPLTWLDPMTGDELRQSEAFLSFVLGRLQKDVGLESRDARAIGHAVLTELVENIAEHASFKNGHTPKALVGAMRLDGSTYARQVNDQLLAVRSFAEATSYQPGDVLRLVVGDAGIGLAKRLNRFLPSRGYIPTEIPFRALSVEEDTAFYSFDRWSTSGDESQGYDRGTRGLNRIERLVRSYGGYISMRTGQAHIAKVMLRPGKGEATAIPDRYRAPGTRLDIAMLPQATTILSSAGLSPAVRQNQSFTILRLKIDVSRGLSPVQSRSLDRAAQAVSLREGFIGLAVVANTQDGYQQLNNETLLGLLRQVALTSTSSALVALILPDVDDLALRLALEDLANEVGDDPRNLWEGAFEPALVVNAQGHARWFGTKDHFVEMLNRLERATEPVDYTQLEQVFADAEALPTDLYRALRDLHWLLERNPDSVALVARAGDLMRALSQDTGRTLDQRLRSRGPTVGVTRGAFLTPTLRPTSIWVDVETLLSDSIGAGAAAFVLARTMEHRLQRTADPDWVVANTPGTPGRLAVQVSHALGLAGKFVQLPSEMDAPSDNGPPFPAGASVVLVSDLISTENSIRRALAYIIGSRGEPVVVATFIDASSRGKGGSLEILRRSIPLVSLTRLKLDAPPAESALIPIDPILRQPLEYSRGSIYSSGRLVDWCQGVDHSMRLGHIAGSSGAHFSVFPLLDRLLEDPVVGEDILLRIESSLDSQEPTAIIFPTQDPPYARIICVALQQRLAQKSRLPIELHPVARVRVGGKWVFPRSLPGLQGHRQVVIIDWGAVTATSIQQMIRLAASSGSQEIRAIVLISELEENEEAALELVATVAVAGTTADEFGTLFRAAARGPEPGRRDVIGSSPDKRMIPVGVSFVTSASLQGFESFRCPMCLTRERYRTLANTSASAQLRSYAQEMESIYAPTALHEAGAMGKDVLGEIVTNIVASDYLRWRTALDFAVRSTAARAELLSQMANSQEEDGPKWSRSALLRLLAAELHWLKLPPLRFKAARNELVGTCLAALARRSAGTLSVSVRHAAVVVLAGVEPGEFMERVPDLIAFLIDEPMLIGELFSQLEHLVRRPPHDTPIENDKVLNALRRAKAAIRAADIDPDTARQYRSTIVSLELHARNEPLATPRDVQQVWHRLLEGWVQRVYQHDLERPWNIVRSGLDLQASDIKRRPMNEQNRSYRSMVEAVRGLQHDVLNDLPGIRPLLESNYYQDRLGAIDGARILRIAGGEWQPELNRLIDSVEELYVSRESSTSDQWNSMYEATLEQLTWWTDYFVASRRANSDDRAEMVVLIKELPTAVGKVVAEAFANVSVEISAGLTDDLLVFVPRELLLDILDHIRANAEHRHRAGPLSLVRYRIGITSRRGKVVLSVANSGSRESSKIGRGIESLNSKLTPFGGSIRHYSPVAPSHWTYMVEISMDPWTGSL